MPTQSEMKVPVPESSDEFEKICLDYIKSKYPNACIEQYGRQGQKQYGVDIVADNFNLLVQCKRYFVSASTTASYKAKELIKQIEDDYQKATQYFSGFQSFIIMTSFDRDARIQDAIPKIGTNISVIFWDTIEEYLCSHTDIMKKYYPQLFSDTDLIQQKTATFIAEVEAFVSFEDRRNIDELRKHHQVAKKAGLYIIQFSDKKDIIIEILSLLDELFPDIVEGRKKQNIKDLTDQKKYISENGPQRLVQYFDYESKEYVEISELYDDCDDYYCVRDLTERIYSTEREYNSKIYRAKELLNSLKAAL